MKLTSSTLLATIVSSALGSSSCDPASVYLYHGKHERHASFEDSLAPNLNMGQNQLVLADMAGTSRYHRFENEQDARLVDKLAGERSLFHREEKNSVVVVVEGVDGSKQELMGVEPSYRIAQSPDMGYFTNIMDEMAQHLHEMSGKFKQVLAQGFNVLTEEVGQNLVKRQFDEEYSTPVERDVKIVESIPQALYKHDKAFVHLTSLAQVPEEQYDNALSALRHGLEGLTKHSYRVAIVSVPRNTCPFELELNLKKRDASPKTKSTEAQKAITGVGQYDSKSKCEAGTNNCSGHGSCVKLGQGKYGCSCKPSYDSDKQKTTHWSGNACQKKDVSVEFQLFFWTGLAILAAVVWGIRLIWSIGDADLPGSLKAGGISSKQE